MSWSFRTGSFDRNGNMESSSNVQDPEDMHFVANEVSAASAACPGAKHHCERSDGFDSQYQGKKNAGLIVRTVIGLTWMIRRGSIGVPMRGKAIADALGFLVKIPLLKLVNSGDALEPGA